MIPVTDYGLMSAAVYDDGPRVGGLPSVPGWVCTNFRPGLGSGLQAAVFTKGGSTVVAFKGTTPTQGSDIVADLKLGTGMNTSYFSDAEAFCSLHANVPDLVVTGHSLGGAIAQTVGNRRRIPFVSFNAPGVAIVASRNMDTANPIMSGVRAVGGALSLLRHPMQAARDMRSAFHTSLGINYRLSGDVVSQIGLHYGRIVTIQASGAPWTQHGMGLVNERLAAFNYHNINFP